VIQFQREFLGDVVGEIDVLLRQNFAELTPFQGELTLDPAWEQYAAMEHGGNLFVITARDGGKLVAYAAFVVSTHQHFRNDTFATNDVLFMDPAYRKGRNGYRFLKFCEDFLQVRVAETKGKVVISWRSRYDTYLANVLNKMGYTRIEILHAKILKKKD
jgi:hypothetical protein